MARVLEVLNDAQVTGTGVVPMRRTAANVGKKIPTRGHTHFALTTVQAAADTATVKLKGTNNPSESDTNGEDLITNTHAAAGQKDGSVSGKSYKYVFVEVTAEGAGAGIDLAAQGGVRLYMSGSPATE